MDPIFSPFNPKFSNDTFIPSFRWKESGTLTSWRRKQKRKFSVIIILQLVWVSKWNEWERTECEEKQFLLLVILFSSSPFLPFHGDNFKRQCECLTALNPFLWCFIFLTLTLLKCKRWILLFSHRTLSFFSFQTEPLRSFQYFPMALLICSIVHLCYRCIINLYVSILKFLYVQHFINVNRDSLEGFIEQRFSKIWIDKRFLRRF